MISFTHIFRDIIMNRNIFTTLENAIEEIKESPEKEPKKVNVEKEIRNNDSTAQKEVRMRIEMRMTMEIMSRQP